MISVIIPVYNTNPKELKRCIESLLQQTYKEIEILLIDDCSVLEDTHEYLKQVEKIDKRIKVFFLNENVGPSGARNLGLEYAKGEYISFVDSDDWLEKDAYFSILSILEKKNYDIVFFDSVIVKKEKKYRDRELQKEFEFNANNKSFIFELFIDSTFLNNIWRMLFRNNIIQKYKIQFPLNISHGEDFIFVYKYILHAENGRYFKKKLYNYVINDTGLTHKFNISKIDDAIYVYNVKLQMVITYLSNSTEKWIQNLNKVYIRVFFYCISMCLLEDIEKEYIDSYMNDNTIKKILEYKISPQYFSEYIKKFLLHKKCYKIIKIYSKIKNILKKNFNRM